MGGGVRVLSISSLQSITKLCNSTTGGIPEPEHLTHLLRVRAILTEHDLERVQHCVIQHGAIGRRPLRRPAANRHERRAAQVASASRLKGSLLLLLQT